MKSILTMLYAVIAYAVAMGAIVYAIFFVGDFKFVPWTVSGGAAGDLTTGLITDAVLLGIFAVQHSLMARPAFKRMWTKVVAPAAERATYVLLAGLSLALLYVFWRPVGGVIWDVANPMARTAIWVVFWAGWGTLVLSTFLIDHFELFGLSQAFTRGKPVAEASFKSPVLYKVVRHPIYLGLLMGFWAAPTMTLSRLFFAVGATGYILVGIWFEERDLVATFGDTYRDYRKRVSMIIPWIPAAPVAVPAAEAESSSANA